MRRARLTVLVPVALLAALLAMPAGAVAADTVTVTGTVVRDGLPQVGVRVTVTVSGSDLIAQGSTDEAGAFSVDLEAGVGSELVVSATGQTFTAEPDANGCVYSETPVGRLTAVIEAEPPAPLLVALDELRTSTVCAATATPRITPPATDGLVRPRPGTTPGGALLLVLGALALAGSGSLILAFRRR